MNIFNFKRVNRDSTFLIIRSSYYPRTTKIDGELLAPLKSQLKLAGPLLLITPWKW